MMLDARKRVWLAAAILASAAIHLLMAARLPIGDDEAYYWLWSRRLAWGYPDHPPMIAALIAVSMRLFGNSPFGLRVIPILLAAATPLILYLAGRSLFDRDAAVRGTLIAMAMPVMALGTAFAFPDVPMMFFWALGVWTGWRALTTGGWWWTAAGVAIGFALLSKLTAFALVLGMIGAWAGGDWRRTLRDPGLYGGVLVALMLLSPVVLWDARHGWFLVTTTLNREPWIMVRSTPEALALFSGGQVIYYGLLWPAFIGAGVVALRRFREPAWRYLAWMTFPLVVVMAGAASSGWTKPHWPAPAYLSAALALGALWPRWTQRRPGLLWVAAGLTVLVNVAAATVAVLPSGAQAVRTGIGRWDQVAAAVDRQLARVSGPVLVVTDTYQAASHVSYYLRAAVPVTTFYGAFIVWQRPQEWTGWKVVYVDESEAGRRVEIGRLCQNVRALEDVPLMPGRRVTLRSCEDLRFP
jgi:4-amino-4-deoxy-L-arabinose transferase-like glycosyltransferase